MPVLFSGLASLVLSKSEINIISGHYKVTLERLLKLHERTPRCVVFFLSGCLPGEAVLHMRQLSLFGMITRLPGDPLHKHAIHVLGSIPQSGKSWFYQIRNICILYDLPHPITLLNCPPTKELYKRMVKLKIQDYWQSILRLEAKQLPSLYAFDPAFMSHSSSHPIVTSATSGFECSKATIQLRMLSGRYRTSYLSRHWSPQNRDGYCCSPTCVSALETLEHIIQQCPYYQNVRDMLWTKWINTTAEYPELQTLLKQVKNASPLVQTTFILDPTSNPVVIRLVQVHGRNLQSHILYLARTHCWNIHKKRMDMIKTHSEKY